MGLLLNNRNQPCFQYPGNSQDAPVGRTCGSPWLAIRLAPGGKNQRGCLPIYMGAVVAEGVALADHTTFSISDLDPMETHPTQHHEGRMAAMIRESRPGAELGHLST